MNVLLIVDIQVSMGHWFPATYLNKVSSFLRKNKNQYDAIYMLMEPDFTYTGSYKNGRYSITGDQVPSFIVPYLSESPFYKAYNYEYWEQVMKDGTPLNNEFVDVPTEGIKGNYTLYMNDELKRILTILQSATDVDIIGGGLSKCVKLTSKLLSHSNIAHQVIETMCYEIRVVNTNWRSTNALLTKPPKSIQAGVLNSEGEISLTEYPLAHIS